MPASNYSFLHTYLTDCTMSLEFRDVCALFEELSKSCLGNQLNSDAIVRTWFEAHGSFAWYWPAATIASVALRERLHLAAVC
jgi:hypothetical protein